MNEPKYQGKFVFKDIQEGDVVITFDPPLIVDYSIYEKKGEDGKDNYPEDIPVIGYGKFDFGMSMNTALDFENNWLVNGGYNGLSKESELVDVLMNTIIFDLFHTFCHTSMDPNYSHYNWALYGNLNDRTTVVESDSMSA